MTVPHDDSLTLSVAESVSYASFCLFVQALIFEYLPSFPLSWVVVIYSSPLAPAARLLVGVLSSGIPPLFLSASSALPASLVCGGTDRGLSLVVGCRLPFLSGYYCVVSECHYPHARTIFSRHWSFGQVHSHGCVVVPGLGGVDHVFVPTV